MRKQKDVRKRKKRREKNKKQDFHKNMRIVNKYYIIKEVITSTNNFNINSN